MLDCSAVTGMDTDGAHALAELDRKLDDASVALHLATVRGPVRDVLERAGLWDRLHDRIHPAIPAALDAVGLSERSPLRPADSEEPRPDEVY